jgi:Tfp pilus assembly protein PilF
MNTSKRKNIFALGILFFALSSLLFSQEVTVSEKDIQANNFYNEGCKKAQQGDLKGAITEYNKAIAFKPDFKSALHNRAIAKYKSQDAQAAMADLDKVLSIAPDRVESYILRGIIKSKQKNFTGAIEDFDMAIFLKKKMNRRISKRGLRAFCRET